MAQNQDEMDKTSSEATTTDSDSVSIAPFDRLMFGNHPRLTRQREGVKNTNQTPQNNIDYVQLMNQVDDIMNSINKIKPAFKELSPLLDFFRKK